MAVRKLVPMNGMLANAEERGYAVGAFNVTDLTGIQAVVQAAEEEHAPVIIQMHPRGGDFIGARYMVAMAEIAAESVNVPVALHLDHGRDLETIETCVKTGFSSVMIDASKLPLAENIEVTQKAVEMAHAVGISAEAELGKIGSGAEVLSTDDRAKSLTDPEEARRFVQETGVDALAVAIGSAHGLYKFEPNLDLDLLKEIRKVAKTRLVLHGGSDLPRDQIQGAIGLGITKVNVATDLAGAYTDALREFVASNDGIIWPGRIPGAVQGPMKELIKDRIRLFGSSGMAD
ncbi:ketose-bisphosphate aldolase [Candidatus Poribacteria bacterium]